jgi:hypothetical protein
MMQNISKCEVASPVGFLTAILEPKVFDDVYYVV